MKTLMVLGVMLVGCGDGSRSEGPAIAEHRTAPAQTEAATDLKQIGQTVDAEVDAEVAKRAHWVPTAAQTKEVHKSSCLKTARKLIKHGQQCGVDMTKYRADRICAELLVLDKFSDEQAVGRLRTNMENGCRNVQLAVKYERI